MWIAPHLTGGLGNRLFQLAAALGLGEKWKREVVFFLPKSCPTNHGPFDTIFRMFPHLAIVETATQWETLLENKVDLFKYTELPANPSNSSPTVVHGWRQSPRYFPTQGIQACLGEALDPTLWSSLLKKYNVVDEKDKAETVFLHVRLGDYKLLPHHQVNLQTYYINCLRLLPPGRRILFFSDEPHLCEQMFQHVVQTLGHSFQCVHETDELVSIALMSQCWGGSIAANSTFSWWGSYFAHTRCSDSSKHLAFFPDKWGPGLPEPSDLYPSWAKKISTEVPLDA